MLIYAAWAVNVTIFSTGSKFQWVSNFADLHALTQAARFFVLLYITNRCILYLLPHSFQLLAMKFYFRSNLLNLFPIPTLQHDKKKTLRFSQDWTWVFWMLVRCSWSSGIGAEIHRHCLILKLDLSYAWSFFEYLNSTVYSTGMHVQSIPHWLTQQSTVHTALHMARVCQLTIPPN